MVYRARPHHELLTPSTHRNPLDLRDFIHGDADLKDLGASHVVTQSVVFALRLVDILREYMDDVPDEMKDEISLAIDLFMGGVGEFVDMDALMQAFGEANDESTA